MKQILRNSSDEAAADAVARLVIAGPEAPPYFSEEQKALRRRLRAPARALGDRRHPDGMMETARVAEAAAYEHWHRMLFGRFLIDFLDAFPAPYTVDRLLVGGFHLVFLLIAFTYGLLKVPALTASLFAGRAGESTLPSFLG